METKETYITDDGDRIDLICFRNYGTCEVVPAVLKQNPHLAKYEILPAGVKIFLPDIEINLSTRPRLWDES